MAVRKVNLCPQSGRLFVGGTAGQVLVFELADDAEDSGADAVPLPEVVKADLVTEKVRAISYFWLIYCLEFNGEANLETSLTE